MTELSPQFHTDQQHVSSSEAVFRPDEIFFSQTDKRGVIIEANSTFRRISGYQWDEIKGAPHKIIRHPDMPKGVFHLMWARLKADLPVVAYVKNRTKEGRYYWVIGFAWPTEDGYLSVRIKPTSDLLREVQAIYTELLEEEKQGASPEESADSLVERLEDMGYASYDSFMVDAINKETAARNGLLGHQTNQVQGRFSEMYKTVLTVGEKTDEMTEVIRSIRTVPMNMRILASRLENAGGPISAISVNYGSMLDEMATWVKEFVEGDDSTYHRIHGAIQQGQLLICAAALQREMCDVFEEDIKASGNAETLVGERDTLIVEADAFQESVAQALKTVETEVTRLSRSVLDMKRYVTGLSSTRMMCKIESAALYGTGDSSLAGIVDQLDAGQNDIEQRLSEIVQLNSIIQSHTGMVRSMT